ncbi:hypothetical protein AUJ66_02040 [Candidatus Desantisbacteria bacterium CG1_02_38_46]|uniref:DUF5678 domain-containing protein n=3 Tax=unclassified Candidatus Desantisiibacteriota TaxID=3106372 RepID=A0A2H9PBS1_9BACT|nr:MAG: hypothetical protein AUJ66_02040 [Candidatus Desantisbacteria bacterium CG1_02_38_46]PIU51180.1 MAG: hypothetical protein COS91_05740 [Candidatus Desantisbacteria bacterium CG07_land_8_20_14_0_80_39_15]PIZ16367.1 MAG: hypothetical protein COY51_02985 [Candidatus Desantisbacteria bacterium CG_4_10_14_0_8_um_filter_39_17]
MPVDEKLKKEFEFYKSQPEEWRKENQGNFVLIKDQKIQGIFESYTDALQEGVKLFSTEKFLIQQVGQEDIINYNTSSLIGVM